MPFPKRIEKRLGELLVELGLISPVQIHRVLKKQQAMKKAKGYQIRLGELLLREKMLDDTALAKAVAQQYQIDYLDLTDVDISLDEVSAIPFDIVKRVSFVPIKRGSIDVTLAVDEEPDEELYKVADATHSGDVLFVTSPRSQVQKLHKKILQIWESGKPMAGTINLKTLDAPPKPAGTTAAVEQAVANVKDDEPLVGATQFRGQRVFKAEKAISLDDGIEDITDLDQALPRAQVIESDGLSFSSGDALDEVLPRLQTEQLASAAAEVAQPTTPGLGNAGQAAMGGKPKYIDPLDSVPDFDEPISAAPAPAPMAPEPLAPEPIDAGPVADPLSLIPDDLAFADSLEEAQSKAEIGLPPLPMDRGEDQFADNLTQPIPEPIPEPEPVPAPQPVEEPVAPAPVVPEPVAPEPVAPEPVQPVQPEPVPPQPVQAQPQANITVPAREEVNEQMSAPPQQPSKPGGHRKMNAQLKEMLLQAVTRNSLGLSFVQLEKDVVVLAKSVTETCELGRLTLADFGDIVLYLGGILKADLTNLKGPLRRKIKLKVGDEAHLFQFLFAPTKPLSMNINILDENLVRYSMDTLGLEGPILDKVKSALCRDYGLTILSSPNIATTEELYMSTLWYLAESKRKVVSFEKDVKYIIPSVSRFQVGGEGVSPDVTFAPSSLRTFLDSGYDNFACSVVPPPERLKTLVNLALSEVNTVLCIEAKDCLTSFMTVKKTGISTSSLIEACLFLINVRRVHRVCPFCKETFLITKEVLPPSLQSSRHLLDLKAYRGKGCSECKNTGVSGTTLLFETMEVDSDRINIDELTRTKKPLKTHLLETGLLKPLVRRARSALLSGRITLKEFLEIVAKL